MSPHAHAVPVSTLDKHIAVLGKTGSGKTYAVRGMVERLLDLESRVCVIDPTGAWYGLRTSADGKRVGYPVVIFGGAHADLPLGAAHGEAIAEVVGTSTTPVILDTSLMRVSERTRFFADFADAIVRKNKGPLHLVIDEAHLFAPQGKVNDPQSGAMLHAANNLISMGRSKGLRVVLITQRPAKVHKDSLTQVETLIALKLMAPQDRKAIEEWIKDNADPVKGREIISSLATMKVGQGWIWAPDLELLEQVKFPPIKTFDSGRAPDGTEVLATILAPIDVQAISDRLQKVSATALSDDPKRLRARIADLERASRMATQPVYPDPNRMEQEFKRGLKAGMSNAAVRLKGLRGYLIEAIDKHLGDAIKELSVLPSSASVGTVIPSQGHDKIRPMIAKVHEKKFRDAPENGVISGLQLRILKALAWLANKGIDRPSKQTVAAVAGVKPTGGYYTNTLGAMRSAGMIEYPEPGIIVATGAYSYRGGDANTEGEVSDQWLSILTGLEREIVSKLVEVHPAEVGKDELGRMLGKESRGGYFTNTLGRLRTLGAIDYPRPGSVALTRYVMP